MHDQMKPWLARRPPLLDSAGAPVLTTAPFILPIDSDTACADPLDMLLNPPLWPITEDLAVLVTRVAHAPRFALLVQAHPDDD